MLMYENIKNFEVTFIKKSEKEYKNQEIIDLLTDSAIIHNDNFFECYLNNEKLRSYIQALKEINAKIKFSTVDNMYNNLCNKVYL